MSIFPTSCVSSRNTCHNMKAKTWLIPLFIHLSSSHLTVNAAALKRRKQMEPCPSSERQFRHFSALYTASVCVSCYLRCFQVSHQKREVNRQCLFSGNLSLRNKGQESKAADLSSVQDQKTRGGMEGRTNRHLRHSSSPPAPPLLTRSLTQEALELHYLQQTADETTIQRAAGGWLHS